jgi:hypothetical protein
VRELRTKPTAVGRAPRGTARAAALRACAPTLGALHLDTSLICAPKLYAALGALLVLSSLHLTLHHPSDVPAPPPPAGVPWGSAPPPFAALSSLILEGALPAFPRLLAAPLPSLHDAALTSYHTPRSACLHSTLSALCAPTLGELSVASVALPAPRSAVLSFDALLQLLLRMRELEVLGVHVGRSVVLFREDERAMEEAWPRMRELALETRAAGKAAQRAVSSEPELELERETKALEASAPRAALGALDLNRAGAEQAAAVLSQA